MLRVLCLLAVCFSFAGRAQELEPVSADFLFAFSENGEFSGQIVDGAPGKSRAAVIDAQLKLTAQTGAFEGGGSCAVDKVFRVNSEWLNNGRPVINIAASVRSLTRGVMIENIINQTSDGIISTNERFTGQFRIRMNSCGAFQFIVTLSGDRAPNQGDLEIQSYQLVSSTDISQTVTEYHYRIALKNNGTKTIPTVVGTPSTPNPNHQILTPAVSWGALAPGATVLSTTLLKIRMPRQSGNSAMPLNWTFVSGGGGPPVANAGPNQTVNLGSTVTLNGSGSSDPNGLPLTYAWTMTAKPTGSAATLSSVSAAMPTFIADKVGTYTIQLVVNNGTANSAPATVSVSTQAVAPTANAGPDQTIALNSASVTVTLNGSGSTSPGGLPLTYSWTLATKPTGSAAGLAGPATVSPTFIADKIGTYRITLVVNNGFFSSAADEVVISTNNVAPVANAGPDQSATVGSLVQLTGAASTDANSLPLTYSWSFSSKPSGSTAALSNPGIVNPTFTMDKAGTYVVQLIVNNGYQNSLADTVAISTNILPPVANAGPDQTLNVGATANLSGAASSDPNALPLTYAWSLTTKPAGSAAVLTSGNTVATSFTIDRAGTYVAQLTVNNGTSSSPADTVTISTNNVPPIANAGPDQNVTTGTLVTLSGALSTGTSGYPLTYSWNITSKPAGSAAALTNPTAQNPSFTADVTGPYIVQLIVNDNIQNSAPDTVQLNASPAPALMLTPAAVNVLTFGTAAGTVTLNAPAPAGGVSVSLSSSNSTAATIPLNVTVPGGSTGVNFTITGGGAAGTTTITATASGYTNGSQTVNTALRTMTVTGPATALAAGGSGSGTLTLADPAPAGGVTVTLASGNASTYTVSPASVSIPAGGTTASFAVQGVAAGAATLTVSAAGYSNATVSITVVAKPVANAGPDQTVINGATVQLSSAGSSDPGGATLTYVWTLTSRPAGSAAVLSSATAANPTFVADVTGVYVAQLVVSNGTTNADPDTVQITSAPPPTIALSPTPINLLTFATANGTVTLGAPAPAGGLAVALTSGSPSVSVPASITVPAGSATATYPITAGSTAGAATITATATGYTNGTQTVNTALRTMTLTAPSPNVSAGSTGNGSIALADPAAAGGVTIALASGNTSFYTLSSPTVTIGANGSAASYAVQGVAAGTATLTASAPGYSNATVSITVVAKPIANAGPDQAAIIGNVVQLTSAGSNDPGGLPLTYSWTLTRPAGSNAVLSSVTTANPTFVADVVGVYTAQLVVNNGANNSDPDSVQITATPPPAMTLSPAPVNLLTLGATTGTVTLVAAAPAGGLTVSFSSNNSASATVLPSIAIAAGQTTGTYTITAASTAGSATITATAPGYTNGTQIVNVSARTMTVAAPAPNVLMGQSGTGSITLTDPAPAGGVSITLASANAGIFTVTTPVVNIAAGATTGTFTVQGVGPGTANINATAGGYTAANAPVFVIAKPVANAGPDQTLFALYTVQLNGSGSTDPAGGTLTYAWTLVSKPAGSAATLSNTAAVNPTFVPDVHGTYVLQLVVNNATQPSDPDTVQIVASPYVITLSPSTSDVLTYDPIPSTASINTNAPPGGFTITLGTSNSGVATAPATITIPAGASSVNYTVTAGTSAGSATITASSGNATNSPTQTVNTTLRAFTIAGIGRLLHTTETGNGTITLANPAPSVGAAITFTSADPTLVSTPSTPVTIPSGSTTGTYPMTGTGRGFAMINASAPGYVNTSVEQGSTPDRLILPQAFIIGVDQTQTYPVRVDQPALRGGYVVTLTNPNPGIGTITPSTVTIPEGALVPPTQPTFTALGYGVTNITASSPGLTSDTQSATVKIKANWGPPTTERIVIGTSKTVTLSLTAPAPAGNLVINLASSNTAFATVPTTVTVLAGQNQADVVVNGVALGTATITASAPNVDPGTLTVQVAPPLSINPAGNVEIGFNLQTYTSASLSEPAPPGGVTVTVTSNSPDLLLSPDGVTIGSSTITRTIASGASGTGLIYLQALASSGTATLTFTSPNYATGSSTVTFRNTGFVFRHTSSTGLITASTIVLGNNLTTILAAPTRLTAAGAATAVGDFRPGAPNVAGFSSSDSAVATVPSTLTFTSNSLASFTATSVGGGVTNLIVDHSGGYTVPLPPYDKFVLTVNAPVMSVTQTPRVGFNLQTSFNVVLPTPAPSGGLPITFTSSNPDLLLSTSRTVIGSNSAALTVPAGQTSASITIQGVASSGTALITVSAPGYANATSTATLVPSGFGFSSTTYSSFDLVATDSITLGSSRSFRVYPVMRLAGGQLNSQQLIGAGSVTLPLTSSNPAVAAVPASITLTSTTFETLATFTTTALAPGTTDFTVTHPAGHTVPTAPYDRLAITVPAPVISVSLIGELGYNLQAGGDFGISATVAANTIPVTIASDNPNLLISPGSTTVGSNSITLLNAAGPGSRRSFYVQALASSGTANVTFSSPGFTSVVRTISLRGSTFVFYNTGTATIETGTTIAAGNSYTTTMIPYRLNAGGGLDLPQPLRPGAPNTIALTSSVPAVGTAPASITVSTGFQVSAVGAGTTDFTPAFPPGHATLPSPYNRFRLNVTVPLLFGTGGDVGKDLQIQRAVSLQTPAPAGGLIMTLTSNSPSILLSNTRAGAGSNTITLTVPAGQTTSPAYFIQSIDATGNGTFTVAAPGYQTINPVVNFAPSGFAFGQTSYTISGNTNLAITSYMLHPTTLNITSQQELRGGLAPVTVDLTNTNPAAATIPASVTMNATQSSVPLPITRVAPGITVLNTTVPAGFSAPSNYRPVTVTVN